MAQKLLSMNTICRIQSLTTVLGNKVVPTVTCFHIQKANLHSVKLQGQSYKREYEPYDYKNKPYGFLQTIYEGTTKRFDPNSKVVVVEGNIGTDKVTVGKKIAEEFDMYFMKDISQEDYFVNKNGFDQRKLNPQLEHHDRFVDLHELYHAKDPKEVYGFGNTQVGMLRRRFHRYREGIRHLLNTGQGVVLERSHFSDRCFADALRKFRYFTREGKEYYQQNYDVAIKGLWKPHLVVYIDQTVEECREQIEKRNNPIEKGSVLLTNDYLHAIEESYKTQVLPFYEKFCEVLYLTPDDLENFDEILHELTFMDLDPPITGDKYKFADWYCEKEYQWNNERQMVDAFNPILDIKLFHNKRPWRAPELDYQDMVLYHNVVNMHPSNCYQKGYEPKEKQAFGERWDEIKAEHITKPLEEYKKKLLLSK